MVPKLKRGLVVGAEVVSMDEPCVGLYELNYQAPGNKGWRRYQIILVVRNDHVAEYREDLGPAKQFKAAQLRIPGGVQEGSRMVLLHTVGELKDMADQLRDGPSIQERLQIEPTDWAAAYHESQEEKALSGKRHSSFGPGGNIQRG